MGLMSYLRRCKFGRGERRLCLPSELLVWGRRRRLVDDCLTGRAPLVRQLKKLFCQFDPSQELQSFAFVLRRLRLSHQVGKAVLGW
jgi:hypothetical protein